MMLFYFDNGGFIQKGNNQKKKRKKKGCVKAGGMLSLMKQPDRSHALIVSQKLCAL